MNRVKETLLETMKGREHKVFYPNDIELTDEVIADYILKQYIKTIDVDKLKELWSIGTEVTMGDMKRIVSLNISLKLEFSHPQVNQLLIDNLQWDRFNK